MNQAIQRWIFRLLHFVFGISRIGYTYSPFDVLPDYAPLARFVFLPAMALTGLWMWKENSIRPLISKGST